MSLPPPTPHRAARAPAWRSKLPDVGTTIFTRMSALAAQHGAINLGQGFPDFEPDPALCAAVADAMREGHNQYAAMPGNALLRERVAALMALRPGCALDAASEITITAGATQALLTAFLALVGAGDEVIVLTPAYDSYEPAIRLAGATPVAVPLDEAMLPDWPRIAAAITPRSRMIVVNTPHNPSGRVWRASDIDALAHLATAHGLLVLSDEVYAHMVYAGAQHHSVLAHRALADRAVAVGSFGKSLHVTGWKIGWMAASAALTHELRKVHQYSVFSVHSAAQAGIAHYLQSTQPIAELARFYEAKRDRFLQALAGSRFKPLPCEGTYFVCADYSAISHADDITFTQELVENAGVAAIPLSVFGGRSTDGRVLRFCFAKRDETLDGAAARLRAV